MKCDVKVSGDGSIKIPRDILDDFGIKNGDLLSYEACGKNIILKKMNP
jgi:bifunctional DNA-binding transcriptional regulator/antitoxin component of YhaV-PrlF toxin-antitoxin module